MGVGVTVTVVVVDDLKLVCDGAGDDIKLLGWLKLSDCFDCIVLRYR